MQLGLFNGNMSETELRDGLQAIFGYIKQVLSELNPDSKDTPWGKIILFLSVNGAAIIAKV